MSKTAARPSWQLGEFDKPIVTATYFGFVPIAAPKITEADIEASKHCVHDTHYDAAEKAAVIRTYLEQNFANLPHPLALIYKRKKPASYSLHYIGTTSGVAEAALIRAALSILSEEGYKNLHVDLNCVGDKESIVSYERELINYVKKCSANLSEECRRILKEDIFNLFKNNHEEMISIRGGAPTALSFLSAQSRLYFKEVLEFVEALGVDFMLTPELVGEKNDSAHTIFGIRTSGIERELSPEAPDLLAVGYRYSRLSKRLGFRKELPMASVTIFCPEKPAEERKIYKELPRPKFYLVQLGREAKIRTLSLIELLRENRIPVHHFLGKDKLTAQLTSAEQLRVAYLIIIGQKEALENTATIRNIQTRAQDTIPMSMLPQYLKHISL